MWHHFRICQVGESELANIILVRKSHSTTWRLWNLVAASCRLQWIPRNESKSIDVAWRMPRTRWGCREGRRSRNGGT